MSLPFAINGLGRIGRALLRIARERPELELVAVNDLGSAAQLAPLIAHDSIHGRFNGEVKAEGTALVLDGRSVPVTSIADPSALDWRGTNPHVVVDATGLCKSRNKAQELLARGVERVLVSANAEGMDLTVCIGVNEDAYDPAAHRLLSAASCTTNCLVPLLFLLDREFGVEHAMLNTVHSYNNDQRLLSHPHKDPRRARAAAINMVPTTTSAIEASIRILPQLAGRLEGFAVRVPTANVSLVDLVVELEGEPGIEELHEVFNAAAETEMTGIVKLSDEPLVSSDYVGESASAVLDLALTQEVGHHLYRLVAWYDNEWGHASRLADLLEIIASKR